MAFALVPEGFELKKVTKIQEKAVDKYYRSQSIEALLSNPTAAVAIIAPIVALLSGTLGVAISDYVLKVLKEEGVAISENVQKRVKTGVSNVASATGLVQEALTTGQISGGSPVAIDVKDLPETLLNEAYKRLGLKQD
tara:strand:- start:236 stop:649 length:414 start_codon:yes stop_codon:yes gene_type:complete